MMLKGGADGWKAELLAGNEPVCTITGTDDLVIVIGRLTRLAAEAGREVRVYRAGGDALVTVDRGPLEACTFCGHPKSQHLPVDQPENQVEHMDCSMCVPGRCVAFNFEPIPDDQVIRVIFTEDDVRHIAGATDTELAEYEPIDPDLAISRAREAGPKIADDARMFCADDLTTAIFTIDETEHPVGPA